MEFDHAGIATRDAPALAEQYAALLDAGVAHEETFDGMQVVFLDLGNGFFELLEPLEGGTIDDYLEDHGPGIHHLALQTGDIERALERAREQGVELIDEQPREGAWGHDVAFLHPASTGGVLLEFVQH
jgi:methylmalonyl-CoA/ethylmalonyl-CoA epimerase